MKQQPAVADGRTRLSVIFVQYDRSKYRNALERLIRLIDELPLVVSTLVVVDNRNPGRWYHEVADRLFHLGGDNSAWEFSAFDRGVRFLTQRGCPTDLYVFVTDAFMAYGNEFLELVDENALRYALELDACVGWVDTIFQEFRIYDFQYTYYLRTSFLFMPRGVYDTLARLNTPFEPESIFSDNPVSPFLPSAPLDPKLRAFLLAWLTTIETEIKLDGGWHSQFELSAETFDLFKQKTLAILREHFLSARLLHAGVPCYDFRLVRRLALEESRPEDLTAAERERWQWLEWRDVEKLQERRCFIDWFSLPEVMSHGDEVTAEVVGWVSSMFRAKNVALVLAADRRYLGRCDFPRDDGLPGFWIRANLAYLPPGEYAAEWQALDTPLRKSLGKLYVRSRCDFVLRRCFLSDTLIGDSKLPVSIEGDFISSHPLQKTEVLWDGRATGLKLVCTLAMRKPTGLYRYHVVLHGLIEMASIREQHTLTLKLHNEAGEIETWECYSIAKSQAEAPHTLAIRRIGRFDSQSGLTSVHLRGSIGTVKPGDKLLLLREDVVLLKEPLVASASQQHGHSAVSFDCQRKLATIPPGKGEFSLAVERAGSGRVDTLVQWDELVKMKRPTIHVDLIESLPTVSDNGNYILRIAGWVKNDFLVDYLVLEVDNKVAGSFGIDQLRPDLTQVTERGLLTRQDFHIEIPLFVSPGEHTVNVVTSQQYGNSGSWSRNLFFEEPLARGFTLISEDIEKLRSRTSPVFWSAFSARGKVLSNLPEVRISLYADNELVDQQVAVPGGEFTVRYVPECSGSVLVQVVFEAGGRILFDSGTVEIYLNRLTIPAWAPGALERLLRRLAGDTAIFERHGYENLLRRVIERDFEGISDFLDMLGRLDRIVARASLATSPPRSYFPDLDEYEGRGLKVLFVCWEVPCLRHGGGVCMTNLLKGLGRRHRITVIHAYSAEEEGWIDDVRPYVDRIISIPRGYREVQQRADRCVPEHYYRNYTPELRQAIEAEVFSGGYDLVNYEYTTMYSHVLPDLVPQVLVIHELGFRAKLTTYFREPATLDTLAEQLDDFLKTFYFNSVALPKVCRHLITLTEEDALALAAFEPEAQIYVNYIGVDQERFLPPQLTREAALEPTLVFLGNYRHKPNVHAAKYFAVEVMPQILDRHPDARFLMIGSHVPEELLELDGKHNTVVTGFVDDFRPYLWNATAFVAPIFVGAGMRVKILEAMACGCLVISSELGMNGLGAVAGKHYLRAETAAEFADSCCRALADPRKARAIGRAARQLIEEQHSWERRVAEREAIWGRLLAESGSAMSVTRAVRVVAK